MTAATSDMAREAYLALGSKLRTDARAWLDSVLADQDLDAIVASNEKLATAYAAAGYPAITVPMSPAVGLTFTGGYLADGEMVPEWRLLHSEQRLQDSWVLVQAEGWFRAGRAPYDREAQRWRRAP